MQRLDAFVHKAKFQDCNCLQIKYVKQLYKGESETNPPFFNFIQFTRHMGKLHHTLP